ncbi:hypothetical protein VTN49DRAFT_2400 [Thermomyces lanuginosus]|uniref:uncharacterized protein n=1 Tax=Thermomyces lanuginosus TaxID=5541 RepID=UPI0037426AB2
MLWAGELESPQASNTAAAAGRGSQSIPTVAPSPAAPRARQNPSSVVHSRSVPPPAPTPAAILPSEPNYLLTRDY